MNEPSETPETRNTVRKTISLSARAFRRAEAAASRERRTLSNYIATLIMSDDPSPQAEPAAAAGPSDVGA